MDHLKHVEGNTFRVVRKDDDSLGETVRFEIGEDGQATRFQRHSIWQERIR